MPTFTQVSQQTDHNVPPFAIQVTVAAILSLLLPIQVQRFPLNNRTLEVGEFRVVGGVQDSYTRIPVRTGGIFYLPWHRHQIEGTDGF